MTYRVVSPRLVAPTAATPDHPHKHLPALYRHKPTWRHVSAQIAEAADGGEEPARNAGEGRRALDEMNADWSDEETNDPWVAECAQFLQGREMDARQHESRWLAGNNLDQARDVFMKAIKRRPIQVSQCGASPVASRALASVLG